MELKEFSEKFSKELENNGISKEELDEIHIKIESNGKLTVSGISDKNVQKRVEELAGNIGRTVSVLYRNCGQYREICHLMYMNMLHRYRK
ncbi:MAG: hypothetical protein ACLR7N_12015 [Roseburia hominis]